MSFWGDIIDALETRWRAADATIPAGALGFERFLGNGEAIDAAHLPHVYAHNPGDANDELGDSQERRTVRVFCDYWTRGATQEEVATVLDAFEAQLEANRTLGAVVDKARIVGRQLFEPAEQKAPSPGLVRRVARVEIEAVKDD